ncbi:DEAD-domain-containing protein [Laetiporus sulphureus 93-53]|uniref:RNA helicase n=1 Tax=Laetiporus sulphureus 93-53 TaxID=1314785 RepID=A0A165FGC8_9APHY|nr:DEAD-domain-containing protein [Laetiporus sulphureus 93-53]KZT08929.1 DEAD-domain-containing protein [Laetiporus sulphureus 93-53]
MVESSVTHSLEDSAVVKVKKPKRSPEKERHKEEKRKRRVEAVATEDTPGRKHKKKSKYKDVESDARSETAIDPSKTEKKRRKREREGEQEDSQASRSDVPKKDKKRRKRDAEAPEIEGTIAESVPDVATPKEEKKKRKKMELKKTETCSVGTSEEKKAESTAAGAPAPSQISAFLTKHSVTIHMPENAGKVIPVLSFRQLDIPSELHSAFTDFTEPTPIQACSWPPALEGRDVVGIAETGSGKTLAFGLPALARLVLSPAPQGRKFKDTTTVSVLVMAPTRELAIQTHETLDKLGAPFGIASVAVFGGVDKGPQAKALKNANKNGKTTKIIVGTPGRILDLVGDGVCDLSQVTYLVLDEADRMLDKGFENDIRTIIGYAKQGPERQTLMFSATWPEAVRRLAASFQRDPVRVTVGSDDLTANSHVEQMVEVFDDARSKDSRLLGHLRKLSHKKSGSPEDARILVFALYKKEASRVEGMLRSKGYSVTGLHGDMSQPARMEALQNFKTGVTGLLVATDVAARGLDIPNVAAVINYTFPLTIEDYIHRIGRTGRGGKSGKSITFFTGDAHERALAGELARVLRDSGFECEDLKKFPMTIKKKTHGAYGAFFRDDIPAPTGPTKIVF